MPSCVDAHRDNGKLFVVRADEKLTAFVELVDRSFALADTPIQILGGKRSSADD